jgi:hypothetical protein
MTPDTGRAGAHGGDPVAEEVKGGGGTWEQLGLNLGAREQRCDLRRGLGGTGSREERARGWLGPRRRPIE